MNCATEVVAREFAKADPVHADDYQANAKAYRSTLDDLKKWAKTAIRQIPSNQRIIPTAYLALSYLVKEFGFKLLPIQGLSTQTQASSHEAAEAVSS